MNWVHANVWEDLLTDHTVRNEAMPLTLSGIKMFVLIKILQINTFSSTYGSCRGKSGQNKQTNKSEWHCRHSFLFFRTGNYYFGSKQNLLQAHMRSHRKHASSVKSKEWLQLPASLLCLNSYYSTNINSLAQQTSNLYYKFILQTFVLLCPILDSGLFLWPHGL